MTWQTGNEHSIRCEQFGEVIGCQLCDPEMIWAMTDDVAEPKHEMDLKGSIKALIAESDGVAGLHLNGDLATWDWLIANGWIPELNDSSLKQELFEAEQEVAYLAEQRQQAIDQLRETELDSPEERHPGIMHLNGLDDKLEKAIIRMRDALKSYREKTKE